MESLAPSPRQNDGHLWLIALGLSLLANAMILAVVGFTAMESMELRKNAAASSPAPKSATVATIIAELAQSRATPEAAQTLEQRFTRTSPEQAAPPAKDTAFIGERDTRATSDRTPVPNAAPLPSQAGIPPRDETEIETTESAYQDGELASDPSTTPETVTPPPPGPTPPMEAATTAKSDLLPGTDPIRSIAQTREKLMEGPNPVDVQVPRETEVKDEDIKPTPEQRPPAHSPPAPQPDALAKTGETPKPKPSQDPAFKGFQRKTAVTGSISRTGKSALDVADSPLGRYQAAIGRAVEQEWQRNCVRHRDFITPGFLTVRFFVEPNGKVRSVDFVGEMETGQVQKGFTLNSIRNAEIPAMPASLRKDYDKEPLELIYNFFF